MADTDLPFHMMPLGSHIKPTNIEEVTMDNMISPEAFVNDYLRPLKPLVLRAVAKQWPAFTKWTDTYLKDNYGKLQMRLERSKEKLTDIPPQGDVCLGRDSLAHFIDTYNVKDVNKFIESELPTPLYKYVKVPPPLGCGNLSSSFVEVDLWMSSGDVHNVLRKNNLNTVTCVVNGTKEWKLVESTYNDLMYQLWRGDTHEIGTTDHSLVNPEKVDLKKFPKIAEIPKLLFASLNAGDCLYLPSESWHTGHSKGDKNVAVGFILQNFKLSDPSGLKDCADKPNEIPLEEVDPEWKYTGRGRMSMGNSPFSYYYEVMDSFFSLWDNKLKYDSMYKMLSHLASHIPYSEIIVTERAKDLYEAMSDLAGSTDFTIDMLGSVSRDKLRELINEYIQPPIPANNCDQEYTYFSPETVGELFQNISMQDGGVISKKKFVAAYVNMGGHAKIAKRTWKRFADDESEVHYEIYEKSVDEAVEKFSLLWREREEPTSIDGPEPVEYNVENLVEDDDDDVSEQELVKDEL